MPTWVVDAAIVLMVLGITYAITSEGLWGSALVFFDILFAFLIAFNFYEPLAGLIASNASGVAAWADMFSLGGLFVLSLFVLKLITDNIAPISVRFPPLVYQIGRLVFGLAGSVILVGFVLILFYTAPVHKRMFTTINYDSNPPFGMGLDHKLLGFVRYSSENIFRMAPVFQSNEFDADRWLIDHQNARPFGTGFVEISAPPPAEGGAAPGGPNSDSPRIPGGTAGAATGLAPQN